MSARVIAIVSLLALTAAGCGSRGTDGTTEPARATPEPKQVVGLAGSIVDVGGHYLYFECVGNGSPTVVLEAAFGGDVKSWRWVQPQLGRTTRTCSYNRAGINGSSEIPGVHDANDEIRDLERLLDRAKIRPPYVLVGHSYGGLLVRLFAGRHPDDVAGIVLLDSAHPDYATRMEAALPPRPALTELRRQLVAPKVVDGVALRKGAALARGVRSLGDTPLVVLTAGEDQPGNPFPPAIVRRLHAVWLQLQDETAALSSEHVHAVALLSDHFIQAIGGQPDVVVRAVRSVVRARRADVPLPSCAADVPRHTCPMPRLIPRIAPRRERRSPDRKAPSHPRQFANRSHPRARGQTSSTSARRPRRRRLRRRLRQRPRRSLGPCPSRLRARRPRRPGERARRGRLQQRGIRLRRRGGTGRTRVRGPPPAGPARSD